MVDGSWFDEPPRRSRSSLSVSICLLIANYYISKTVDFAIILIHVIQIYVLTKIHERNWCVSCVTFGSVPMIVLYAVGGAISIVHGEHDGVNKDNHDAGTQVATAP